MLKNLVHSVFNQVENPIQKIANLKQRLVFGNYPELLKLHDADDKRDYLQELVNAYLLRDILAFENIRNSDKILQLLRLIAFQIGSEVSNNELARQLSISKNTVEKYLDLLSKVFVIHSVSGFSRNLRKEISKGRKWYFYDNGLRNVLIGNVNQLELRNDVGALWENYAISERLKLQHYQRTLVYNFFWRTYDQQEINWIEERGGELYAYEFKWNPKKKIKEHIAWSKSYPESHFSVIHPDNFLIWIASHKLSDKGLE